MITENFATIEKENADTLKNQIDIVGKITSTPISCNSNGNEYVNFEIMSNFFISCCYMVKDRDIMDKLLDYKLGDSIHIKGFLSIKKKNGVNRTQINVQEFSRD